MRRSVPGRREEEPRTYHWPAPPHAAPSYRIALAVSWDARLFARPVVSVAGSRQVSPRVPPGRRRGAQLKYPISEPESSPNDDSLPSASSDR